MLRFPINTGAYQYRALKTGRIGWDCYGVQRCLIGARYPLPQWGADGNFGAETHAAVKRFQAAAGLTEDGIAGVLTQRSLVLRLIAPAAAKVGLPSGLEQGQVEAESSYWVGNHTAQYDDGTRDFGLTMKHLLASDARLVSAFDGPARIVELAGRLRGKHDDYYRQPGAKTHEDAWRLAVGSWNAPAWTDTLARGGTIRPEQQQHLDAYIERAIVYCGDLNVP